MGTVMDRIGATCLGGHACNEHVGWACVQMGGTWMDMDGSTVGAGHTVVVNVFCWCCCCCCVIMLVVGNGLLSLLFPAVVMWVLWWWWLMQEREVSEVRWV